MIPDGYHYLGAVLLYAFVPLYMITTIWFILRRRYFPISGRYPKLSMAQLILVAPWMVLSALYFYYPSTDLPCILLCWLYSPGAGIFVHVSAIRCALLLCQCEVTADLKKAEHQRAVLREQQREHQRLQHHQQHRRVASRSGVIVTPAGTSEHSHGGGGHDTVTTINNHPITVATNPSISAAHLTIYQPYWQPSWWTRHRYYLRGPHLRRLVIGLISMYLLINIGTIHLITSVDGSCDSSPQLQLMRRIHYQAHAVLAIPSAIALAFLAWNLRRHSKDAYGLITEFIWSGLFTVITALTSTGGTASGNQQWTLIYRHLMILFVNVVGWAATGIWPLYVSYRHQRRMAARLKLISNVTRLSDLLAIDDGYDAFLSFARAEFTSEGVLFYKRVNDFRDSHRLPSSTPAAAAAAPAVASAPAGITSVSHNAAPSAGAEQPVTAGEVTPLVASPSIEHMTLLAMMVEAKSIYCYYVDLDAPNELLLETQLRFRVRATLDNICLRMAMANNYHVTDAATRPDVANHMSSMTQIHHSPQHHDDNGNGSPNATIITRKGVSISLGLPATEAMELINELRVIFDECQRVVVERLDALSFQRFRASDAYQSVLAKLRGFTVDKRHASSVGPAPRYSSRDRHHPPAHGGGHGHGGGGYFPGGALDLEAHHRGVPHDHDHGDGHDIPLTAIVEEDHLHHHDDEHKPSSLPLRIHHDADTRAAGGGSMEFNQLISPGGGGDTSLSGALVFGAQTSSDGGNGQSSRISAPSGMSSGTSRNNHPNQPQQQQQQRQSQRGSPPSSMESLAARMSPSPMFTSSSQTADLGFGDLRRPNTNPQHHNNNNRSSSHSPMMQSPKSGSRGGLLPPLLTKDPNSRSNSSSRHTSPIPPPPSAAASLAVVARAQHPYYQVASSSQQQQHEPSSSSTTSSIFTSSSSMMHSSTSSPLHTPTMSQLLHQMHYSAAGHHLAIMDHDPQLPSHGSSHYHASSRVDDGGSHATNAATTATSGGSGSGGEGRISHDDLFPAPPPVVVPVHEMPRFVHPLPSPPPPPPLPSLFITPATPAQSPVSSVDDVTPS